MGTIEFLNDTGETLAIGSVSDDLFQEGQHGEVKEFAVAADVKVQGRISRYRCTSRSATMQGVVTEGTLTERHRDSFCLTRLNVLRGDRINGVFRALTIKDEVVSDASN